MPGSSREVFSALSDITFQVDMGERVGIIGRNGAGKSTLLKILSRVTEPTHGRVELRGRVASLLEVGTGFHSELTGRENIFLSGAVLGMSKAEIRRRFDEIVAFAETEKFLDTPVKRYSSGMYVRLAFAVAAHLEADILIVDEVLAVGDHQFQQKCIGKMQSITGEDRTLLFVSHNLGVLRSLCDRALCLEDGRLVEYGKSADVVSHYLERNSRSSSQGVIRFPRRQSEFEARIVQLRVLPVHKMGAPDILGFRDPFAVEIEIEASKPLTDLVLGLSITNEMGEVLTTAHTHEIGVPVEDQTLVNVSRGTARFKWTVEENILRPGRYFLNASIFNRRLHSNYDVIAEPLAFVVEDHGTKGYFDERQAGLFFLRQAKWSRIR